MGVYFLVYLEGDRGRPFDWPSCMVRADQVVGMFNWNIVYLDMVGQLNQGQEGNPLIVHSLDEALAHPDLMALQWVWLHPKGTDTLQKYEHPSDNVVYCVGSDFVGFDNKEVSELNGDVLRVWTPDPNREYYAETVIHLVVYDRALKTLGA